MAGLSLSAPITESLLDGLANSAIPTDGSDIFDILPPPDQIHMLSNKSAVEETDDESKEDFKERLTAWILQMMFVSGETAEPSTETTGMIEELVKQQVIEMVSHPSRVCLPEMVEALFSGNELVFV